MTKQIEILGCFVEKITSGLPQRGIWFGTNTRCIEKLPSFRLVLHKVAVVNEWRGRISATIDKSCTQYGPHHVEHRFFNYPLAQHVWHYVAKNHLATFFFLLRVVTLIPGIFLSWCNVLLISLSISHWNLLVKFGFVLRSGLLWIIWCQWNNLILNNTS